MGVIGIIANLREALEAFIDNPNTTNQMVLERAMRVYQSKVTAMERALTDEPHNHGNIGTVFLRDCPRCEAIGRRGN